MIKVLPPNVCIDGAAIRRIREEKKLTQLYVAKVVGVTTDTISRWENNRYPTIKRENVLRLGEALEVPVDAILQAAAETGAETDASPEERKPASGSLWMLLVGGLVVIALGALVYARYRSAESGLSPVSALRVLLPFAAPGSVIPVRIMLNVEGETKGYIVREHFPPGWKLIEASPPPSSLDNEEGTVRWIVKPGERRALIAYLLRVDLRAGIGEKGRFGGEVVANADGHDSLATITGDAETSLAPYLWADLNGDGSISDGEMLEASDTVEDMSGVHLDWKQLEVIWDAGSYFWDKEKKLFAPLKEPHPSPQR